MAKDGNDARKRRREREDEQEVERLSGPGSGPGGDRAQGAGTSGGESERLTQLLERADPMIEQLDSLYMQYMAGVEWRPPLERRKQLEQLMATVRLMSKPTQIIQFQSSTLLQRYEVHRDRWDRIVRDVENGKIKRVAGPKRA